MIRCVTAIAAGPPLDGRAVTIERDCFLVGYSSTTTIWISLDASDTAAALNSPTGSFFLVRDTVLAKLLSSVAGVFPKIPLSEGMVIYLSSTANYTCVLYLEDAESV